jgi:hypothetical protein
MQCTACGSSSFVEGKIVTDGGMSFRPSDDSKLKRALGIGRRSVQVYACLRCGHLQFAVDFGEDDMRKYQTFEGQQPPGLYNRLIEQG